MLVDGRVQGSSLVVCTHRIGMVPADTDLLQTLWGYSSPIVLTPETVIQHGISKDARQVLCNTIWWSLLLTTRILLAHASLESSTDQQLLSLIATNLRALLRLGGVELADKGKLSSLAANNAIWFRRAQIVPKHKYGFVYCPLKRGVGAIMASLETSSYAVLAEEYEQMLSGVGVGASAAVKDQVHWVCHVFGHITFHQVATRYTPWQTSSNRFASLLTAPVDGAEDAEEV